MRMPSRLMLTRQSPFGRPSGGVEEEAGVAGWWGEGAGWWKYHHSVAHSIMAIWRVGEALGLNSEEEGLLMEEM